MRPRSLYHEDAFRDLLRTPPRLLDALTEVAPEFRQALANTAVFSGTLAERSQDLTELMVNGADFADVAGPLLESQMPNLGCLFSDAADLNDFLADPAVLRNLQLGLDLNEAFFGPVNALAVEGHAIGFPQFGSVDRNDQGWLRVQTLLPPGTPMASRYTAPHRTPSPAPVARTRSAPVSARPRKPKADSPRSTATTPPPPVIRMWLWPVCPTPRAVAPTPTRLRSTTRPRPRVPRAGPPAPPPRSPTNGPST